MKSIHNKYFDKFENVDISKDSESSIDLYNKYKTQIDEAFSL